MKSVTIRTIRVYGSALARHRGRLVAGPVSLPCALGRTGLTRRKREGDGATPVGTMGILGAFYRPDRLFRPRTLLSLRKAHARDGWCDAPEDRRYNRPVVRPYPARTETLWRADHLYDVVLDLDWNRGPIRPGHGSAIFLHAARSGFQPTEGCVALRLADLRRLIPRIGPRTQVVIAGKPRRQAGRAPKIALPTRT